MRIPSTIIAPLFCLLVSPTSFAQKAPAPAPAAMPAPAVKISPSASVTFKDAAGMPKGVQSSLQYGDPTKGPYTVLLKIPAGTTLAPHWHSADEVTTVVSGTLLFGAGEKIDEAKAKEIGPGGYVSVAAKAAHWARAKTDVITARFANGPGDVNYVDAKDDPRKK